MKKRKRKRKYKRILRNFFYPLMYGTKETVEPALVCLMISVFRFLLTGKFALINHDVMKLHVMIYCLIVLTGAVIYITKNETIFDKLFILAQKMARLFLFVISVVINVFI